MNTNGTAAPDRSVSGGSGVADDHRSPLAWLSDKITSVDEKPQPAPFDPSIEGNGVADDLSALSNEELLDLIARLQARR